MRTAFISNKSEDILQKLLGKAGIEINGSNPWDIQVHDDRLYDRILGGSELDVGESYMDGWWDCQALDQFFDRVFRAELAEQVRSSWRLIGHTLKSKLMNLQKDRWAYEVGKRHYDVGNDFYRAMLDKRMTYTCGYWKDADDLDGAQEAKLDLVCRKIGLTPGMCVLDLGCGWGCFGRFAAERYGARVTGVTVSKEQAELGNALCRGLPVEIRLEDYRNVNGEFDRVISIGIMEHVGYKNYRGYMEHAQKNLKDDGVAFIHTIGGNTSVTICNPWTVKHIFPNSMLPSIAQLGKAMEGLGYANPKLTRKRGL